MKNSDKIKKNKENPFKFAIAQIILLGILTICPFRIGKFIILFFQLLLLIIQGVQVEKQLEKIKNIKKY